MPDDRIHSSIQKKRGIGSDAANDVEAIVKLQASSEEDEDRIRSLALFGQGRLLFQQDRYGDAFALYQRAWQWNQDADTILWEIVPLAFHLDRPCKYDYAVLANERAPRHADSMHQIAMYLAQDGESDRVLRLLDKAIKLQAADLKNGLFVEMHLDRVRICAIFGRETDAVDSAEIVRQAINAPSDFDLIQEKLDEIVGKPSIITYNILAEIFAAGKQPKAAQEFYERIHQVTEDDALRDFHLAQLSIRQKQWTAGLKHLRSYFDANSQSAAEEPYELYYSVLKEKVAPEDLAKKSIVQFEKLLNRNPENGALVDFVGEFLITNGELQNGCQTLEPLLSDDPTTATYQNLMTAYTKLKNRPKLIALLGQAIDATGGVDVFSETLDELLTEKELVAAVITEAENQRKSKRRPLIGSEAFGIGLLCLRSEKTDTADQFFEYAMAKSDDVESKANLEALWAEQCFDADHFDAAIPLFQKALASQDESVNVRATTELLAFSQELNGDTAAALETVDNFLKDHPDAIGVLARKAWIHSHAANDSEAMAIYEKVVNDFGGDYTSKFVRDIVRQSRTILSSLKVEENEVAAAQELLLTVLDEYPQDVGPMNDLGYLWADNEQHLERAERMIRQAVDAEPDNPAYLDSLGWLQYRLRQFAESEESIQTAVDTMDEPDGILLDHLGDVLAARGKSTDARKQYQRALELLTADEGPQTKSAIERVSKLKSKLKELKQTSPK